MTKPVQELRFDRVIVRGASEIVATERGNELRVYTSVEDAVILGLEEETARRLFEHIASIAGEPGGGCVSAYDTPGEVTCDSIGCTGTCKLYSVPNDWKYGDPKPTPEPNPASRQPGRIYFCLCEH